MPCSMKLGITDSARDKIQQFLEWEGSAGRPLRFSVERTHCMGGRGHGYDLRVANGREKDDVAIDVAGLSVLVDPASARLAKDIEIEYVEGFEDSGFKITNSNAVGKCPCGHHDLFA